jgi:chemotaxis protein CheY-P-specific phosphatase CheC
MATDLSVQLQEAITSTIETFFSSGEEVLIGSIYKSTEKPLAGLNTLVINTSFAFEKLATNFTFVLPAKTATVIAHAMLMEDALPVDTISDDIADAMKESITQICGTLQTVVNASDDLADLGKVSFSVGDFEIIDGTNYKSSPSFILLKLIIGENSFDYFLDFEENFLPFIQELMNSETLEIDNKKESEEVIPASNNVEETNSKSSDEEDYISEKENSLNEVQHEIVQEETSNIKEDENIVDSSESFVVGDYDAISLAKKNKRIKIIIIALGAILAIVIIGFSVLLYMGYFDKEEVVDKNITKEQNITKLSEESLVMADIKNKQIDFKLDMINQERLNNRLQYLTKYEILEEDVLAKFKKAEAERLYKLKMEKLEEFAMNNQEESLYKSNIDNNSTFNEVLKKSRFDDSTTNSQVMNDEENAKALDNELLMFIKIDPKTYKKYKEAVDENKQNSTQVSICKDINGVVNVYVGPLYLKTVINNIVNGAKKVDKNSKNDMEIITITRGDFNKMCDF